MSKRLDAISHLSNDEYDFSLAHWWKDVDVTLDFPAGHKLDRETATKEEIDACIERWEAEGGFKGLFFIAYRPKQIGWSVAPGQTAPADLVDSLQEATNGERHD